MSKLREALAIVDQLTPEQRKLLLTALAQSYMADLGAKEAVTLLDDFGTPFGYLFPIGPHPSQPPVLTAEEEAELREANEKPGVTYTTEQIREFIRQGGRELAAKS